MKVNCTFYPSALFGKGPPLGDERQKSLKGFPIKIKRIAHYSQPLRESERLCETRFIQ